MPDLKETVASCSKSGVYGFAEFLTIENVPFDVIELHPVLGDTAEVFYVAKVPNGEDQVMGMQVHEKDELKRYMLTEALLARLYEIPLHMARTKEEVGSTVSHLDRVVVDGWANVLEFNGITLKIRETGAGFDIEYQPFNKEEGVLTPVGDPSYKIVAESPAFLRGYLMSEKRSAKKHELIWRCNDPWEDP